MYAAVDSREVSITGTDTSNANVLILQLMLVLILKVLLKLVLFQICVPIVELMLELAVVMILILVQSYHCYQHDGQRSDLQLETDLSLLTMVTHCIGGVPANVRG